MTVTQLGGTRPNTMRFMCPHCGTGLSSRPDFAGRVVRCPKCCGNLTIPRIQEITQPNAAAVNAPMLAPRPSALNQTSDPRLDQQPEEIIAAIEATKGGAIRSLKIYQLRITTRRIVAVELARLNNLWYILPPLPFFAIICLLGLARGLGQRIHPAGVMIPVIGAAIMASVGGMVGYCLTARAAKRRREQLNWLSTDRLVQENLAAYEFWRRDVASVSQDLEFEFTDGHADHFNLMKSNSLLPLTTARTEVRKAVNRFLASP